MKKQQSIQETLDVRGSRHGDFSDNSRVAQRLKEVLRESPEDWDRLDAPMKESLDQICSKISRLLCGDPNYDDNWRDISGYATLALERLNNNNEE